MEDVDGEQIALVTACVGGAFALLGGWLGVLWGQKTEHKQWFRNEQIRYYSAHLDKLTRVDLHLSELARSGSPDEILAAGAKAVEHLMDAADPSFRLVAPHKVVADSDAMMKCLVEKAGFIVELSGEEREKALGKNMEQWDHLVENFLNSARASFGAKEKLNFHPRPESMQAQ